MAETNTLRKLAEASMAGKFMLSFAFSAAAVFWATPNPDPARLICVLSAVYCARSAGCLFNNIVDRKYDIKNSRTKDRPLADGSLRVRDAVIAIIILAIITVICAWMLSPIYVLLLPVAVVPAFFYSFTKRFTWLCHGVLGVVCAAAPVGSWIVFCDKLDFRLVLLGGMVALWTAGYDILYSSQDTAFDKEEGLYSIPAKLGLRAAMWISVMLHALTILAFFAWGICLKFGLWYYIGAALSSLTLVWEHLPTKDNPCGKAPITLKINQWVGTIMFLFALAERYL